MSYCGSVSGSSEQHSISDNEFEDIIRESRERYTETILIPAEVISQFGELLNLDSVNYAKNKISPHSTLYSKTVEFVDEYEAEFRICSADEDEPLCCEIILFQNGCEVCRSKLSERFKEIFNDIINFNVEYGKKVFSIRIDGEKM